MLEILITDIIDIKLKSCLNLENKLKNSILPTNFKIKNSL